MAFRPVNDTGGGGEERGVTKAESMIQLDGWRGEYEEVIRLIGSHSLEKAWEALKKLLEGELFAGGPSVQRSSAISGLQHCCLALALDLLGTLHRTSPNLKSDRLDLALEAVEWFPQMPAFWRAMANALLDDHDHPRRDLVVLTAAKLALTKTIHLNPFDVQSKKNLNAITTLLGSFKDFPAQGNTLEGVYTLQDHLSIKATSQEWPSLENFQLEIAQSLPLSRAISKLADLADEILHVHYPKRNRHAPEQNSSLASPYHAQLVAPVQLIWLNGPLSTIEPSPSQQTHLEEGPNTISQASGIKSTQEEPSQQLSQSSSRTTTRRHLKGREAALPEHVKISPGEVTERLGQAMSSVDFIPNARLSSVLEVISRPSAALNDKENSSTTIQTPDQLLNDPAAFLILGQSYHNQTTSGTLASLMLSFVKETLEALEHQRVTKAVHKNLERLVPYMTDHLDYFVALAGPNAMTILLWLLESSIGRAVNIATSQMLIDRVEIYLEGMPDGDQDQLIRLLWCKYLLSRSFPERLAEARSLVGALYILASNNPRPVCCTGGLGEGRISIDLAMIKREISNLSLSETIENTLQALEGLDATQKAVWIDANCKIDPIEWLIERQGDGKFCMLALQFAKAFHLTSREQELACLAMTLFASLRRNDHESLRECMNHLRDDPEFLMMLRAWPQVLAELITTMLTMDANMALLLTRWIVGMAIDFHLDCALAELVILLWRDYLIPAKLHLTDPVLLEQLCDLCTQRARQDQTLSLWLIHFCALRSLIGAPYIEIVEDKWELNRRLGSNDKFPTSQQQNLKRAEALHALVSKMVDVESVDACSLIAILDHLIAFYGGFHHDTHLELALVQLKGYLSTPLSMDPDRKAFRLIIMPILLRRFSDLDGMLEMKSRALLRLSSGTRRRTIEMIKVQRQELKIRLLLRAEEGQRWWDLGESYRIELELWMTKEASLFIAEAKHIAKLVRKCALCWRQWYLLSLPDHLDQDCLCNYLYFLYQLISGPQKYFLPSEAEDLDRRKVGLLIRELFDHCRKLNVHMPAVLASAVKWTGGSLKQMAEVRKRTLLYLAKHSSAETVLYRYTYKALALALKISDGEEVLAEDLLQATIQVLDKHHRLPDRDSWEGKRDLPLKMRITQILSQLGKLDTRKRTQHLHIYRLALLTQGTWQELKTAWSKLLPIVAKPKSSQLVAVWQNDQDCPGRYLVYSEKYLLRGAAALAAAAKGPSPRRECARILATMIGRVAAAANVIVRRCYVMTMLLGILAEFVMQRPEEESLEDFTSAPGKEEMLRELLLDAAELVEEQKCQIPEGTQRLLEKARQEQEEE